MNEIMTNALVIDEKDTVAVAIEPISAGSTAAFVSSGKGPGKALKTVTVTADIPIYHKFAIKNMVKGEPVVKYGEHIGLAAADIPVGSHVHVHNVENHREQL